MRPLSVWGGWIICQAVNPDRRPQARAIVATSTQTEAMRLLGSTRSHFKDHFCETGNDDELSTALGDPGVVFVRAQDHSGPGGWQRLSEVRR